MKQTPNLSLKKPELTDVVNIEDLNQNFDTIDTEIKGAKDRADEAFQSASDGKVKIATAITGKGIPTSSSDTFQKMATNISAIETDKTGDATAVAGDILATKTAYAKGIKLTGTMQNNGAINQNLPINGAYAIPKGYHDGSGKVIQSIPSKVAETIIPSTSDKVISNGQYLSGAQTIRGDANLIPANIATGKTIFGVAGTYSDADDLEYNFPLTISTVQPSPIREGHVWVNSNKGNDFWNVRIVDNVTAGSPNNTLYFAVHDMTFKNEYFRTKRKDTANIDKYFDFTDVDNIPAPNWLVSYKNDTNTQVSKRLPKPTIYSMLNGVLDVETAYMWNGSSWILLSQKGTYIAYPTTDTSVGIFNITGDTITEHSSLATYSGGYGISKFSADGTYLLIKGKVYKRTGDVFSLYKDSIGQIADMSKDGSTIAVISGINSIQILKNNGTTFVNHHYLNFQYTAYSSSAISVALSHNGNLLTVAYVMTSEQTSRIEAYYADSTGTFKQENFIQIMAYSNDSTTDHTSMYFSNNGKYVTMRYNTTSGGAGINNYIINYINKTLLKATYGNITVGGYVGCSFIALIGEVIIYVYDKTFYAVNISTGAAYALTFPDATGTEFVIKGNKSPMGINLAETRGLCNYINSPYGMYYYAIAVNHTAKTVSITRISKLAKAGYTWTMVPSAFSPN